MNLGDFRIGLEFGMSNRRWRCTDVGSRVVVAIRVDEVSAVRLQDGVETKRVLDGAEAQEAGWFNGPPYGVPEIVFDEDDLEQCSLSQSEA